MVVEFYPDVAPMHVESFIALKKKNILTELRFIELYLVLLFKAETQIQN